MRMARHSILGAGKTPEWAGATPLFRLSAAQKVRGVAPARHACRVTVFWARAYRDAIDPKCSEYKTPNKERRESRCQS